MKIQNVTDVDKFFKVIDECKGTVELVSPDGDRINLKSKLAQYVSIASIFANGYIRELDLVAHEKEDIERLIRFMYQGEKYLIHIFQGSEAMLLRHDFRPCFYIYCCHIPINISHFLSLSSNSIESPYSLWYNFLELKDI